MRVFAAYGTAALIAISTGTVPAYAYDLSSGPAAVTQVQSSTDSVDWVLEGLRQAGYRIISVKSTFLGRIRILAENRTHRREIIVSRSTGVIFRDRIEKVGSRMGTSPAMGPGTGDAGTGAHGSSDDRSRFGVDIGVGGADLNVDTGVSASSIDENGDSGLIGGAIDSISDILGGN